jgi:hypothetical protein
LISAGLTGLLFTGIDYKVNQALAKYRRNIRGEYELAAAGLGLEGVNSYTSTIASLVGPATPKPWDFIKGFIVGAALSGERPSKAKASATSLPEAELPRGAVSELSGKIQTLAGATGDNLATGIESLREWLRAQSANNPKFLEKLYRNMSERLAGMSDAEFARVFGDKRYATALSRLQHAMRLRVNRTAYLFETALKEAKSAISGKKAPELSPLEELIAQTQLPAVDIVSASEQFGPRETAMLARAADEAARVIPGEAVESRLGRMAEFIEKLCQLASSCSSLSVIRGCPR